MDKRRLESEFDHDAQLRAPLSRLAPFAETPPTHDASILQAARDTSQSIQKRLSQRVRWHIPLSLAASFLVGIGATLFYTSQWATTESQPSGLVMPVAAELRGSSNAREIPVEQAPADAWYHYIQELVYSGDAQLAAKHLQRFVELHPDYVHRP